MKTSAKAMPRRFRAAAWIAMGALALSGCRSEANPDALEALPNGPEGATTTRALSDPIDGGTRVDPSWDPGRGEPVRVAIRASKAGFEPPAVTVIQGRPAFLEFTRTDGTSCVNAVKMPWSEATIPLPEGETVAIQVPDTSQAGEFTYGCWMGMLIGSVVVAPAQDGG